MAKIYDFAAELKRRQKRSELLNALDIAATMVKRDEVEGMAILIKDRLNSYPFWRRDVNLEDLEVLVNKLKEVGDDKFR